MPTEREMSQEPKNDIEGGIRSTDLFCSAWVRLTPKAQVELQREYHLANDGRASKEYQWFVDGRLDYRELCRRKSHAADWRDKIRTFLLYLIEKFT